MRTLPRGVWGSVAAKVLLHLATTRLDFHRDELYFIAASKRLAPSYVDFQPVTPLLVRLVRETLGESLFAIRLIPTLAGAVVIVLAALLARDLGGNRRAQTFAAFAAFVIPLFVGANSALNTVTLEVPAWLLVALALARTQRTDDPRRWLWVGAAVGLALLVKFTVLGYLVGLPIAILLTPALRKHLRTPWPWLGGLVALAIVTPSLFWQYTNGFPIIEFVGNQGGGGAVLGLRGRAGYIASLVLFPGPFGLFLLIPGLRWLFRDASHRAVAISTLVPLVVFFVASGKGYYATPALAVAFAAGAIAVVTRHDRIPRLLVAALVLNLAVPLPLLVPLVPTSVLAGSEDLAQATELGERLGWDDLANEVDDVSEDLHPSERARSIVIGSNYGVSSAVELRSNLARVAVSGHNSAYLWWPNDISRSHVAIAVGLDRATLRSLYGDVTRVGTVRNRDGVHNYEWGDEIFVAREPRLPVDEIRERLRIFTA